MEFNTRGFQWNRGKEEASATSSNSGFGFDTILSNNKKEPKGKDQPPKNSPRKRPIIVVFISAVVLLLLLAVIGGSLNKGEAALIEKNKHQVVALSDDRAFFGKITKFSDQYIVLEDVFYLNNVGTDSANSAAQLIKRGCEPWRPTDRMVIYRSDVLFWENIQDDGQIAKIIAQWKEQNSDGQTCNTTNTTTQTPTNTPSSTAPANNATPETTPPTGDTTESNLPPTDPETTE